MNILSDSFSVFVDHWQLVTGILLMMFLSQMLLWSVLRIIFRGMLTSEEYVSLAATGWILPLSLASVLWVAWGMFEPSGFSGLILLFTMTILAIALLLRTRKESLPGSKAIVLTLLALFGAFIFLRLAFLSKVLLPLYFDSAQHYLIVKNVIQNFASNEGASFLLPTNAYYHVGFHLLTAFTASSLRADVIESILILGQMIVAAIPLSIFPIIKRETQSSTAGLFAVLLAAFGWYMPAYAVNWGKYPALASLPLITFVISLAYLSLQYKSVLSRRKYLWLLAILVSGIFISVFFHSRSLVILGSIALAWITVLGWQRLSKLLRIVTFLAVITGILLVIMYIRTKDVFGLLFDPYWEKGLLVTVVVFVLALFAPWAYPRLTFASILVIFLMLASLLIPVRVPGYGALTLLDRPFVEMSLYLPLSFLGGAGLAGLEKGLQQWTAKWALKRFSLARSLGTVFIVLLLLHAVANYNFYPAGCCSIIGRDDLVAIDWMDKNLPSEARIAISSTELKVIVSDSPQGSAGGDAGIWITPLTDRATIPLPYQSDFSQQAIFDRLCQQRLGYLYVGETGTTFNNGLITAYPDRYQILLSMPKAKLYQVMGCSKNPSSKQSVNRVKII
jgi:hypothetical protein